MSFNRCSSIGVGEYGCGGGGQYAPELIFGESRTSSNFDANEKRIVGGKNGMGAKVCNIFSEYFEASGG